MNFVYPNFEGLAQEFARTFRGELIHLRLPRPGTPYQYDNMYLEVTFEKGRVPPKHIIGDWWEEHGFMLEKIDMDDWPSDPGILVTLVAFRVSSH